MNAPHALLYPRFRWLQRTTYTTPPVCDFWGWEGQTLLTVFSNSVFIGTGVAQNLLTVFLISVFIWTGVGQILLTVVFDQC